MSTAFHAKYFAHELTKRCPSDSIQKLAATLETKVALHKRVKELEVRRSEKRRGLFEAQDAVDARKDALLTEVEARLKQTVTRTELFTVRWKIE